MKHNIKRYIPQILTGLAAVGIVGFGYTVHLGTKKEAELPEEATNVEKAKCYIPAFILLGATEGCIIGSQVLTTKQIATLTAGAAATAGLLREYKGKIKEVIGEEQYDKITQAIAKDHEKDAKKAEISEAKTMENYKRFGKCDIVELGNDSQTLFYDPLTKKWFRSSMLAVVSAEFMLNRNMAYGFGATLGDFYNLLGITCDDSYSEFLSWDVEEFWEDENCFIDFSHTKAVTDGGEEYYIIQYDFTPQPADEEYAKE